MKAVRLSDEAIDEIFEAAVWYAPPLRQWRATSPRPPGNRGRETVGPPARPPVFAVDHSRAGAGAPGDRSRALGVHLTRSRLSASTRLLVPAVALVLMTGGPAAAGTAYLMVPPPTPSPPRGGLEPAQGRSVRDWVVLEVFRSVDECEQAREAARERAREDLAVAARLGGAAYDRVLELQARLDSTRCVAAEEADRR